MTIENFKNIQAALFVKEKLLSLPELVLSSAPEPHA